MRKLGTNEKIGVVMCYQENGFIDNPLVGGLGLSGAVCVGEIMQVNDIDIDKIKPYQNNPRINDDAVEAVARSIEQYGFKVPIVIDSNNVIVCGHTRHRAAKQIGLNTVPCIIADDLDDDQIAAFRIADNKTADMSLWDNKRLLDELDLIPDDLFTGFELGGVFDNLNEDDCNAIDLNEDGIVYEITLRSEDEEKINKVKQYWEELADAE